MAESLKSNRVIFPTGKQREFLLQIKERLGVDSKTLAEIAGTGVRNLSTWKTEKGRISLHAVELLCKKAQVPVPSDIEIKEPYWHIKSAAKKGGRAKYEKYGKVNLDEEYRKRKWQEWWDKEGKYKGLPVTQPKSFVQPEFSERLAEFVGIVLGDGGISNHQITVTLHSVDDKEYFTFVEHLIQDLFKIPTGVYINTRALAKRIVISRTGLVKYLTSNAIGLKKGNKVQQQVDIPPWIKINRAYSIACLRGLIDTDGCAIIHRYRSKGKQYSYRKIGFTSHSFPLLQSVSQLLSELGINNRIMKNEWDIRIEAQHAVKKYMTLIGSHNPKHLRKLKNYKGEVPERSKGASC